MEQAVAFGESCLLYTSPQRNFIFPTAQIPYRAGARFPILKGTLSSRAFRHIYGTGAFFPILKGTLSSATAGRRRASGRLSNPQRNFIFGKISGTQYKAAIFPILKGTLSSRRQIKAAPTAHHSFQSSKELYLRQRCGS